MRAEEKEGCDGGDVDVASSGKAGNVEVGGGKTMIKVKFGEGTRLDKLLARERPSLPFSVIQKIIRNKKVGAVAITRIVPPRSHCLPPAILELEFMLSWAALF